MQKESNAQASCDELPLLESECVEHGSTMLESGERFMVGIKNLKLFDFDLEFDETIFDDLNKDQ